MADLQPKQFGKRRKDPMVKNEHPVFSGGQGSKTMPVEKPKGLKKSPKKHPHRNHAGVRSKRAVQNKKAK